MVRSFLPTAQGTPPSFERSIVGGKRSRVGDEDAPRVAVLV
jgi:hypothetical protein